MRHQEPSNGKPSVLRHVEDIERDVTFLTAVFESECVGSVCRRAHQAMDQTVRISSGRRRNPNAQGDTLDCQVWKATDLLPSVETQIDECVQIELRSRNPRGVDAVLKAFATLVFRQ